MQHTTNTTKEYPCLQWNSNPQFQQSNDYKINTLDRKVTSNCKYCAYAPRTTSILTSLPAVRHFLRTASTARTHLPSTKWEVSRLSNHLRWFVAPCHEIPDTILQIIKSKCIYSQLFAITFQKWAHQTDHSRPLLNTNSNMLRPGCCTIC